eukprot:10837826-Ditylum_brightwellii.AAC.1
MGSYFGNLTGSEGYGTYRLWLHAVVMAFMGLRWKNVKPQNSQLSCSMECTCLSSEHTLKRIFILVRLDLRGSNSPSNKM